MSRERWGRQILKPSAAGNRMDKCECARECTGADKGMGAGTKQTHTRQQQQQKPKDFHAGHKGKTTQHIHTRTQNTQPTH